MSPPDPPNRRKLRFIFHRPSLKVDWRTARCTMTTSYLQRNMPNIAQGSAVSFSVLLTAIGIGSFISPDALAEAYGLPETSASQDKTAGPAPSRRKTNPWIPIYGSRDLALGLSALTFAYQRNFRAMGTVLLCGVPVGLPMSSLRGSMEQETRPGPMGLERYCWRPLLDT